MTPARGPVLLVPFAEDWFADAAAAGDAGDKIKGAVRLLRARRAGLTRLRSS